MMLALLIVLLILSFACSIWALVIIFKRTVIGGLLSLFLGLPMLYFLVTGWGKEGEDIKKPFFLSLILYGVALAIGMSMGLGAAMQMQDDFKQQMSAPPARSTPTFRETAPAAADSARPRETYVPATVNTPAPPPQRPSLYTETPAQRPVQETQRRPKAAQSNCVYKPVMTDEDIAKCR